MWLLIGIGAAAHACTHALQAQRESTGVPSAAPGLPQHSQAYWEMRKLVVTPNVPNYVNITAPLDTFTRPIVPLEQRNLLMYFSGRCGPHDDGNLGKLFRCALLSSSSAGVCAGHAQALPDWLCESTSCLSGSRQCSLLPSLCLCPGIPWLMHLSDLRCHAVLRLVMLSCFCSRMQRNCDSTAWPHIPCPPSQAPSVEQHQRPTLQLGTQGSCTMAGSRHRLADTLAVVMQVPGIPGHQRHVWRRPHCGCALQRAGVRGQA